MDGNTRLCTATAASALKASFGTDGQPGSYSDVDHCDAIALWGHNVTATQTVLWMRMLGRRHGSNPPAMLAVDPRTTPVAREADLHLALRAGTNQALLNGLLRLAIHNGWYDDGCVSAHTIGFEELAQPRVGGVRRGVVFVPFHYGYFDVDPDRRVPRAANELTLPDWDPVSKRPIFKVAAVRVALAKE